MSITSDEVNYLIYRYLLESGVNADALILSIPLIIWFISHW